MSVLVERIEARLEALKMSARRASLEAGLSADALRAILTGRSESPRAKTLQAIATALRCDPAYLLGTQDEPGYVTAPVDRRRVIRIGGEARFGSWGEGQRPRRAGALFVDPLVEFPELDQYAMYVADRHVEELVPSGAMVHMVKLRPGYILREGDVVEVIRSRFDGMMVEITLRQVIVGHDGTVSLTTRYRNSEANERLAFGDGSGLMFDGPDNVRVVGLALRAHVQLSAPPVFEFDDEERQIEFDAAMKKIRLPG